MSNDTAEHVNRSGIDTDDQKGHWNVGLCLNAKRRGILSEVKPVLDGLGAAGFRISRELYRESLRLASETV